MDHPHGLPRPHALEISRNHKQSPRLIAWILWQIGHLYHIEAKLRESKADSALSEAVRASQSRMIHRRLKKLFEKLLVRRAILPESKLGKAVRYALNQWTNLEVYLGDGRGNIDNNLIENAIRPAKLGARNWLFIGNEESGLEDVLTRLPAMQAKNPVTLTPANWLKALRGNAAKKAA